VNQEPVAKISERQRLPVGIKKPKTKKKKKTKNKKKKQHKTNEGLGRVKGRRHRQSR